MASEDDIERLLSHPSRERHQKAMVALEQEADLASYRAYPTLNTKLCSSTLKLQSCISTKAKNRDISYMMEMSGPILKARIHCNSRRT